MRVVTTCHAAGFEQYGAQTLAGLEHWPAEAEIVWYCENFDLPVGRAKGVDSATLPKLAEFKAKWSHYDPPDWRYDVVRFANKVYAAYDALRDYDGLGIWMDADIVAHRTLPPGYLESLLPEGYYLALFQRDGIHSETGLWLVDCAHPQHKRFMDTFIAWYEQGTFRSSHEWHDCAMMDSTIRAFQKQKLIEVYNLSGEHSKYHHPMAKHPIARYVDHLKGPTRKALGQSPENAYAR